MDNKNMDKALDIISKLINGEEIHGSRGEHLSLYEEYTTNSEVFDMVQTICKKMNLSLYEYNNGLYMTAGINNQVFGFRNDELKKAIGVRLNRELYLCYFIIYNAVTRFYNDSSNFTYVEYIKVEDLIAAVDSSLANTIVKLEVWAQNEVEENSFKTLAMMWEDMPIITGEESSPARAARNSKTGYVKMVLNFLVGQDLLLEAEERYYPKERMKALIENYFEEHGSRLHEIMQGKGGSEDAAY